MNKLAKNPLLGLFVLAIAALMAHAVNCSSVGHHDLRTERMDVRALDAVVAKASPDNGNSSNGGNDTSFHQPQGQILVALLPDQVHDTLIGSFATVSFAHSAIATRNTALAHRRVTVLLI
ncbi:MAG: hypothetical protein J0H10_14875 [Alphaproteobacteria bacterium]|jgi:hypothetical protein|nr:hypothetical protein [Alphaproteobacteria bacterium]MBN9590977.1 hypothetical protein [Alphaproteobacteria bacterium]